MIYNRGIKQWIVNVIDENKLKLRVPEAVIEKICQVIENLARFLIFKRV